MPRRCKGNGKAERLVSLGVACDVNDHIEDGAGRAAEHWGDDVEVDTQLGAQDRQNDE